MKIEKKTTFTVYGMEFDNLKTAQFFVRYVTAVQARVTQSGKLFYVSDVLNEMRTFTNADAADLDDEYVVAYVMAMQMPKPPRKPKKKNVQVLADDVGFKNMDPAPGEQEETHLHVEPGASYLHVEPVDAFDTTFAKVSTPVEVGHEYW